MVDPRPRGMTGSIGRRADQGHPTAGLRRNAPVATATLTPRDEREVALVVASAFAAYHAEIAAYLRRVTREPETAEDLAQEAFLRLHRSLIERQGPVNTRAWLYRVAGNLAISRGRHLAVARRVHLDREDDDAFDSPPEALAIAGERYAGVGGAMSRLPPDTQRGLALAAQGYSGREIAASLGRSEGATRTLLCRARGELRRQLLREELDSHDQSR
jgi:RNA polymerase sigma factor (sigma-70 family)